MAIRVPIKSWDRYAVALDRATALEMRLPMYEVRCTIYQYFDTYKR